MEGGHAAGKEVDVVGVGLGVGGELVAYLVSGRVRVGDRVLIEKGFGMAGGEAFAEQLPALFGEGSGGWGK